MADPLSEQDLAAARAELAEGRPVRVWFTAAAVGVPVGGSAKIVSVGDVAEGDFVEVRPTGSRDTVFCSPNELTSTRPPRRRAQPAEPAPPQPSRPPAAPARRKAPTPAAQDVAAERAATPPAVTAPVPAPAAPKPARARTAPPRPAEVTVTLSSTADGEWTVEVTTGRKRAVRPTPVQPAEVAKAARALPAAVAEAIDASLVAARQRQVERVERLRSELDAAQRALEELSG